MFVARAEATRRRRHHCAWREYADELRAYVDTELAAVNAKLEALAAHVHESEKLPRVADEVREVRPRDPKKTQTLRAARAEMKARLVEEKIKLRVPEPARECPKCGKDKLRAAGSKTSTVYEYVAGLLSSSGPRARAARVRVDNSPTNGLPPSKKFTERPFCDRGGQIWCAC